MEKLLIFGLQDELLVHIEDVPNGISCNCKCPSCGERLIAVANDNFRPFKKIAHFRHVNDTDCPGAYETALHLLAKEVLGEIKKIQLPDFHVDYNPVNPNSKEGSFQIFEFDSVSIEERVQIGDEFIVCDAIGLRNEGKLMIEFANSHFIDDNKKRKIKKGDISCVEINLKDQILSKESLKNFFLSKTENIYWIYNPVQEEKVLNKLKSKAEKIKIENEIALEEVRKSKLNIIKVVNNKLWICPKKVNFFDYMKKTLYYTHPVLKRIIDGEFWNEKFYGNFSFEEFIYLKDEKILTSVYPDVAVDGDEERSLLRNGLKQIIERKQYDSRLCDYCKFNKDYIRFENEIFQLCSFTLNSGPIKDL